MGRTKKQKAAAAKDEPGPDDYIFLAVFFPVGRSGAALARDEDPADIQAAQRIGRWMHEAGLPIRKLFTRKSEQHVIVEVRKTVPEDVINSKLGAYKWVDTIVDTSKIPPQFRDCETTILRARVRSHDAIDKMGGMVYFPIEPIIPNGPRSESQFRNPFPKPKRVGYAEPSTFSIIKYHPLPPEFTVVEDDDTQPDVKPDIKPDVKPSMDVDVKPDISREATQAPNSTEAETKPKPEADTHIRSQPSLTPHSHLDVKPKTEEPRPNWDMNPSAEERRAREEVKPKIEEAIQPNYDMNPSPEERRAREETKPKIEEAIRPNWDMNPSAEERLEQERFRLKHEEQTIRPNWDMNPSTEERREQERRRLKLEGQGEPTIVPVETESNLRPWSLRPNWKTNLSVSDRQAQPSELGPSPQQNGTPAGPPDAQNPELEIPPRVKAEPQQPPAMQKRPAEDSARQDRDIKRERLG